jgi:outer membrane receptor protein involved in Fe transport
MKKLDLLGATALALFISTPALAQTAPAEPQADDADVEAEEIIVTASKREQTLQDTPISVAVASKQQIEQSQIRDLIDLQTLVPSLKVGQLQSSANTNFVIRGFGNGANNPGIEPSVGVFIDGVYRSRSAAQIGDLPNITRVEVLRGPQSTLFGKNASAGIISIVTAEPQFDFGGSVEAVYGNFNSVILKGDVTGPIIADKLAFSLAGNYNKRDGFARDLNLNTDINDRNRYSIRGQLLFEPNSDLKIRIIGDFDNIDEVCCTVANLVDGATGNVVRALGGRVNSNQPFSRRSFNNFESSNDIDNYGVSAQINYNVTDTLSVTSISAYRAVDSTTNQDSDFTSADLIGDNLATTKIDTYTQELRIASDFDGPLNFLLGGYYFDEKIDFANRLTFGRDFRGYINALSQGGVTTLERTILGLPAGTFGAVGQGAFDQFNFKNDSFSIFGQVDFEIGEKITLTAGFNYTDDSKKVRSNSRSTDAFSAVDLVAVGIPVVRGGAIASGVGQALRGANGAPASQAEIAAFAGAQPAAFAAISAGATAFANSAAGLAANPLLPLRPLQFLPPFLNFPNAVESGKTSDQDLSYTLRLAYKVSSRLNLYATYATGFKASSFNLSRDSRPTLANFIPGSPVTNPPTSPIRAAGLALPNLTAGTRFADPEEATNYEIGLKGNFPGVAFNLAIFQQELKGFQSNVFQGAGFVLGNAEKQTTKGVEFDISVTPIKALNFTAAFTYLDPKFDKFTGGSAFNPATNTVVPTNLTGRVPSGQSPFTIAVGGTYTQELGGDRKIIFHADYDYSSPFQIAQGLPFKADPETLNASITFVPIKNFELSVFGRNLTEPKFNPVIFPSVAQPGSLSAYPSPPRTYGISGRFKF